MTDIYCFNDPIYLNNKPIWTVIHGTIYKAISITRKIKPIKKYYEFFKSKKSHLWSECNTFDCTVDEIINTMIFRSTQICHHELIYLHSKSNAENWKYPNDISV